MKIGFVSRFAPDDRRSWSGTNFKLYEALSAQHAVTHIPFRRDRAARAFGAAVGKLARWRGKEANPDFTHFVARRMARSIDQDLVEQVDVLFVPFGSTCLSALETTKPVVYLSDATFAAMDGYYASFSNLLRFNHAQGAAIEQRALDKASRIVLASGWAKASAVEDYGQDPRKVRVIELGANLRDDDPASLRTFCRDRRDASHSSPAAHYLLFLGVDWERKGGDIAVECCRLLNERGIPARLHVVGTAVPARHRGSEFIVDHGFLDKNVPEDFARLNDILASAHLLLLPTRAECAGIVFCEASAYGVPSFTLDTGGTADYVENGVNGYRLPPGSAGPEFAARIAQAITSGDLERLRQGSFRAYADRLNWNRWQEEFTEFIRDLV